MRKNLLFASLLLLLGCGPKLEPLPQSLTRSSPEEARKTLIDRNYRVVPVSGTGSMSPWIPSHPDGRKVIVAYAGLDDTPYAELKSGNVVIYSRYGVKIIHRIGQQDKRGFLSYGINNNDKDRDNDGGIGFVTEHNFIGKVALVTLFPINK